MKEQSLHTASRRLIWPCGSMHEVTTKESLRPLKSSQPSLAGIKSLLLLIHLCGHNASTPLGVAGLCKTSEESAEPWCVIDVIQGLTSIKLAHVGQLESSKSAMYTLAPEFSALITCICQPTSVEKKA